MTHFASRFKLPQTAPFICPFTCSEMVAIKIIGCHKGRDKGSLNLALKYLYNTDVYELVVYS